jgi:preprotein translocase subunit SecD
MSLVEQGSGESWVTDHDIERAEVEASDYGPMILIVLSKDAGERVRLLASQNMGKSLAVKMDNRTLVEAQIRGEFGASFQVLAPLGMDANVVAAILEAGSLPAPVVLSESPQ